MENLSAGQSCARAWAAGLFDAEGSATHHVQTGRSRSTPALLVYQAGRQDAPPVLLRFRDVVECGSVLGPYRGRLWCWRAAGAAAIARVTTDLWPWLGAVPPDPHSALAWAGGFFTGEGSVSVTRSTAATRWPRTQAEITQASADGVPDVLTRFHLAVMRVGAIRGPYRPANPWSRLPQYRWAAGSFEGVQAVIALLWPWLDERKRTQAALALRTMAASRSARGDAAPR